MSRRLLALLFTALKLCTAVFFSADLFAADDPREFTGVWQAFASEPAFARDASAALTPEGQTLVADFNALYPNPVEPGAYCVPPGMPATMTSIVSYPIEILHSYNRITILAEMERQVRRVFMDGRAFPTNYPTTRMGYSIGHWENDTLVIETRLLGEMLLGRSPRTENTVVVERVSKIKRDQVSATPNAFINDPTLDDDVLAFQLTISDPVLYREPQVVTVYYQHISEDSLLEYDCEADLWLQALDAANQ